MCLHKQEIGTSKEETPADLPVPGCSSAPLNPAVSGHRQCPPALFTHLPARLQSALFYELLELSGCVTLHHESSSHDSLSGTCSSHGGAQTDFTSEGSS